MSEKPEQPYLIEPKTITFELREIDFKQILKPVDKIPASSLLISQVKTWGLINEIIVAETEESKKFASHKKSYKIIAGRRRHDAIKKIQKEDKAFMQTLTVKVCDINADSLSADAISILENRARSENPLSEAYAVKSLRDQGVSPEEIAAITGLMVAEQDLKLSMLKLNAKFIELLQNGGLSVRLAEKLTGQKPKDQEATLAVAEERWQLQPDKPQTIRHSDLKQVKLAKRASTSDAVFAAIDEGLLSMEEAREKAVLPPPAFAIRAMQQIGVLRIMLKEISNPLVEELLAELETAVKDDVAEKIGVEM